MGDADSIRTRVDVQDQGFETLFRVSPLGLVLTTEEGCIVDTNRAAVRLLGFTHEEMLNRTSDELGLYSSEARLRLLETLRNDGFVRDAELTLTVKSGERRDMLVSCERVEMRGLLRYFSTFLDITARKRIEDALRKAERDFRTLVERLPDPVWIHRDGTLVYVNAAFVAWMGLDDGKEILGRSIFDTILHHDERVRMEQRIDTVKGGSNAPPIDVRMVRRDKTVRVMETTGMRLDFDGDPSNVVVGRDVTDKTDLQTRLVLSDRMASLGLLAAGVAHEINNPLAYVTSNLELIAEDILTLSTGAPSSRLKELTEMVNEARQGANRVRRIVNGLKTFSRADAERRVALDVRAVLDLSTNIAFNEIKHRARLIKEYGDVPLVEADEALLSQVFINLLVNAAQAIPEGHVDENEIRIVTRTDALGRTVVRLSDTGHGMPPETLARIFDPFFTTKAIGEGTGLGLSICHSIVSALGGAITAASQLGKGAVFEIVLPPATVRPPSVEPQPSTAVPAVAVLRRGQVLVVDDDLMVGNTIRRILHLEHDVTTVSDGEQALELLLAMGQRFDVVVCDLMMPRVTGMELHARLTQMLPDIVSRIVFMTGGAFTPAARGFLDGVPNQRLEKPFAPQNLRALVRSFVH